MGKKRLRFPKVTLVLNAATATLATLLCLPCPTHAQSSASQDRQGLQSDDVMRTDLARFDQFLDGHREIADQLRKTPSLVDDPQFLQSHPELNAYLQDHPSVKQEISERPDTFMSLEDRYSRDRNLRDRDAGGQDRDADRRDVADRDNDRRDVANFDRFLDAHREISEQVRKDPSLLDNRDYVRDHPALEDYFRDNPGVRDQMRRDPTVFMRQEDAYDRDTNMRDRDAGANRDRRDVANFDRFLDGHREISEQVRRDPSLLDNRDFLRDHQVLQTYLQNNPGVRDLIRQNPNAFMHQEYALDRDTNMRDRDVDTSRDRRDVASFDRFLDAHREIAEQIRKDPSLLENRQFVQNHPALQTYLQNNVAVRDQISKNPAAFMHQEDAYDHDTNNRDRNPGHDRMADFGGFLHDHSDIRRDLSEDPSKVKDHDWMQSHAELDTYLNAHPDVQADLMANPQSFVKGAQQYSASPGGTAGGAGGSGGGTGTTGSATGTTGSMTGTSTKSTTNSWTNPATAAQKRSKPNL